jgi:hypothetical protein
MISGLLSVMVLFFAPVDSIIYVPYLLYLFLRILARDHSSVMSTDHVKGMCISAFHIIGHDCTCVTSSNCSARICSQPHDINLAAVRRPYELSVPVLYSS